MYQQKRSARAAVLTAVHIVIIIALNSASAWSEPANWQDLLHLAHNVSKQVHGSPEMISRGQDSAIGLALGALKLSETLSTGRRQAEAVIRVKLGEFYLIQDRFVQAEKEWLSAYHSSSVENTETPTAEDCLHRLGLIYSEHAEDWEGDAFTRSQALALRDTLLVRPSTDDIPRLARLADVYDVLSRWDVFHDIQRRIVSLWTAQPGGHAGYVVRALMYLAENCSKPEISNVGSSSDYQDSAIVFATRALAIAEAEFDQPDTLVAFCAIRLGDYHDRLGHFHRAVAYWEHARDIQRQLLPPEHIEYQGGLYRMAGAYCSLGRYSEAEEMYREALQLREKTQGKGHPEVAFMHASLAYLLQRLGRYDEAEFHYNEALRIRETAFERIDSDIAQILRLLGQLYFDRGLYPRAEANFLRAIETEESASITNPSRLSRHFVALADLYQVWNRLPQASQMLTRVLELQESFLNDDHPDIGRTLRRLAQVAIDRNEPDEAEELLDRSLAILKPAAEFNRKELAECYYAQAAVARLRKDTPTAVLRMTAGLDEGKKVYDTSDSRLIPPLIRLAEDYLSAGDSLRARMLMVEAEGRAIELEGSGHPRLADLYEFQATFEREAGHTPRAIDCAYKAFQIRLANLLDGATVMTERDALSAAVKMRVARDRVLELLLSVNPPADSTSEMAAETILRSKGVVSESALRRARNNVAGRTRANQSEYDSLHVIQARLSHLYTNTIRSGAGSSYASDLVATSGELNRLKSEIAHRSPSVGDPPVWAAHLSSAVRDTLPEASALVEYLRCRFSDGEHYTACVLSKRAGPRTFDLGLTDPIDSLIDRYRGHFSTLAEKALGAETADVAEYRGMMARIQTIIWEPLRKSLGNPTTLFVSPDGALGMLSWPAFVASDGSYLIENMAVDYLSSGRDLLFYQSTTGPSGKGLLAIGDPDFRAAPDMRRAHDDETQFASLDSVMADVVPFSARLEQDVSLSLPLARLYGTRKEVEGIAHLWSGLYGEAATPCLGAQASEETFKSQASGHRVIHIATHGYFAAQGDKRNLSISGYDPSAESAVELNPLLSSGLCLAGLQWDIEGHLAPGEEDGLLTSEEIAGLELGGTRWVVLSACETAQGTPVVNEGLFGLRRAFQLAGAHTVVSSLWSVSDRETVDLMEEFYRHATASVPQALRDAELHVLETLRSRGLSDHPCNWAGFIATGDWHPAF